MPGDMPTNIRTVFDGIKKAYKQVGVDTKHRYPTLRLSQFKSGHVGHLPKLKGTGMQAKGLSKVMHLVFNEFMDEANPQHIRVRHLLLANKEVTDIYDEHVHAHRFPAEASERLIRLEFEIAQDVSALIQFYHPLAMPLFHFTLKQHYTLHAALSSRYGNPSHGDCSSGEDLMKTAKAMIKGAMHGNGPVQTSNKAMSKYVKALHLSYDSVHPWWK